MTDRPFEDLPANGLVCPDCLLPQRLTPSGASCPNGHGGAQGIDPLAAAEEPIRRTLEVVDYGVLHEFVLSRFRNEDGREIDWGAFEDSLPDVSPAGPTLMALRHFCDRIRALDETDRDLERLCRLVANYVGYDNFIDLEG